MTDPRLLAVSDLHVRDPENRAVVEGLRPGSDGDWLIGTGMAVAAYPIAFFMPPQRARARILADGSAVVQTSTQEFGTGVLTMATQVAADALGVALSEEEFASLSEHNVTSGRNRRFV